MKAGALRHKVAIQRKAIGSPQEKPTGQRDTQWADYLTGVSAEWVTLRGASLFAAQQHHAEVRGLWRIRWRDGPAAGMRVVHNGLYYNILFVPPYGKDGKKVELDLECAEGMRDGSNLGT